MPSITLKKVHLKGLILIPEVDSRRVTISETRERRSRAVTEPELNPVRGPAVFISEFHRMKPSDLGRMNIECLDCGTLHWKTEKSVGSTRASPVWEACRKKGALIKTSVDGTHPKLSHYLKNCRQYNSAFSFTSLGTSGNG
ncbi:hypothetical protein EDC94DRAFT_595687 [Helicostylum pulchrum]|nr:hypothetical protein EDC94DRAFT_595687 [Helicostylum pulchrum]